MAAHCKAMVDMQKRGSHVFDYGNNLRAHSSTCGFEDAFASKRFVPPAYIRPLFCEGMGPFSQGFGDPEDTRHLLRQYRHRSSRAASPRTWLKRKSNLYTSHPGFIVSYAEREKVGLVNELVWKGEVKGPDCNRTRSPDCGSVASLNRETEAMKDGFACGCRLAIFERDECRERRKLVSFSPWRRRGYGLLCMPAW